MNAPLLSIITVNYNNKSGLIKTLNSIKNQENAFFEHIIIDANSTDGSMKKKLHIRFIGYQSLTTAFMTE